MYGKPYKVFDYPYTRRSLAVVTQVAEKLFWIPERVGLLMLDRKIPNRSALAKTLGIPRATINDAFTERWEGRATTYLIAVMCSYFRVRMADIVQEPVVQINGRKTVHPRMVTR